jgi:hypothetical protein
VFLFATIARQGHKRLLGGMQVGSYDCLCDKVHTQLTCNAEAITAFHPWHNSSFSICTPQQKFSGSSEITTYQFLPNYSYSVSIKILAQILALTLHLYESSQKESTPLYLKSNPRNMSLPTVSNSSKPNFRSNCRAFSLLQPSLQRGPLDCCCSRFAIVTCSLWVLEMLGIIKSDLANTPRQ